MGIFRPTYHGKSPEQRAMESARYRGSIGLKDDFKSDAFDKYEASRIKDFHGLEIKTPNGSSLIKLLAETDADATKIKEAIKSALTLDLTQPKADTVTVTTAEQNKYLNIKEQFAASIVAFNANIKSVPEYKKVQDLIQQLYSIRDTGRQGIVEQQKEELSKLKANFTNEDFKDSVVKALKVSAPEVDSVKDSLVGALEETHKKQLAEFDKSAEASINKIHQAAAAQLKEQVFLATLRQDSNMKKEIEKIAEKNRLAAMSTKSPMTLSLSDEKVSVASVSLDQLEFIQRATGGRINIIKDPKGGQPVYELELNNRIRNPLYYFNNNAQKDMAVIADAIRASGCPKIVMSLEFSNQKVAQQRVREAYQACIESGFAPDNITIEINGRKLTAKDLQEEFFNKDPNLFKKLQSTASEMAEIEKRDAPPGSLKDRLSADKGAATAKMKTTAPEEATNDSQTSPTT